VGFWLQCHYFGDFPIPEPSKPVVTTKEGKLGIDIALNWINIIQMIS